MAALTLDALLRSLKKKGASRTLAPVYLLHGDEDVLKDEAVRTIVDVAVASRDFNLDTRYAADLTPESFNDLVNTPPMLAERRAVVLRGIDQLGRRKSKVRDELDRYLTNPNPTTTLILVVSAGEDPDAGLVRRATAVRSEPLEAERIPRWINHHAGSLGLTFAPDAVDLLIAAVGGDLSALAREIEKLAALAAGGAGAGRPATPDDVAALVGVRRGETIFDLVEAALGRDVAKAAQLVEPVLEQAAMSGVKIVSLLGTHLVGTALARAERDKSRRGQVQDTVFHRMLAARPYGLRNYKEEAARWSSWSERWSTMELRDALRAALQADVALKNPTVTDDRGILMRLVLGFAPVKREAA